MHDLNELELWRQHHDELLREAENARLARRVQMAAPKRSQRFGSRLFAGVRVHLSRGKRAAEC